MSSKSSSLQASAGSEEVKTDFHVKKIPSGEKQWMFPTETQVWFMKDEEKQTESSFTDDENRQRGSK